MVYRNHQLHVDCIYDYVSVNLIQEHIGECICNFQRELTSVDLRNITHLKALLQLLNASLNPYFYSIEFTCPNHYSNKFFAALSFYEWFKKEDVLKQSLVLCHHGDKLQTIVNYLANQLFYTETLINAEKILPMGVTTYHLLPLLFGEPPSDKTHNNTTTSTAPPALPDKPGSHLLHRSKTSAPINSTCSAR